ncbi:hypothetical protein EFR01_18550 [Sinorhizobium fredii]|nr:hypothetical protein EFR01_18550 [Sinorhizobium fredii]GLS09007.1 hypothetical protein GCM10007864_26370 [Sinorhizobium fredii]
MVMGFAEHHKPRTAQDVVALPVKIAAPKVSHYFLRKTWKRKNPLSGPIEAYEDKKVSGDEID